MTTANKAFWSSVDGNGDPKRRPIRLGDAIEQYITARWGDGPYERNEMYKAGPILKSALADLRLEVVTQKAIQTYCDERLLSVRPATVRAEARIVRCGYKYAKRAWGLKLRHNPEVLVALPPAPKRPRARVVTPKELDALYAALAPKPLVRALVELTIETGMDRGELLRLEWTDVNLDDAVAHLRPSRASTGRTVELNEAAVRVLRGLDDPYYRIFHMSVPALRWAWEAACRKADIKDLRLHNLRRAVARGNGRTPAPLPST